MMSRSNGCLWFRGRGPRRSHCLWAPVLLCAAIMGQFVHRTWAVERVTYPDPRYDQVARLTDAGANGSFDPEQHRLPDLLTIVLGQWQPTNPRTDPFDGHWGAQGKFFRLDLDLDGVVNPPGPVGCCGEPAFDPFRYGPNPICGYIELDMDLDVDTGGETESARLRYLGNIARFGGTSQYAPIQDRIALNGLAFDSDLTSAPWVERSGEDFHLALVGWEIGPGQIQRSDTSDWIFGAGETWWVTGHLFQRAHGYSQFSSACCRSGAPIGNYDPSVTVRFSHNLASDRTTISLVYPLTQEGAAAMHGNPQPETMDVLYTNQSSVQEGLWELKISAESALEADRNLPEFALIAGWEEKDPDSFLDPAAWRITALLGGSYTSAEDALFVWSDVFPNVLAGDFDGDGNSDADDLGAFDAFLLSFDGVAPMDADGQVNGSVLIADFATGFSVFDLDYDGVVSAADRQLIGDNLFARTDFDHDGDADQADFAYMQRCLGEAAPLWGGSLCQRADLDKNGDVNADDLTIFTGCATGPAIPADIQCGRNP